MIDAREGTTLKKRIAAHGGPLLLLLLMAQIPAAVWRLIVIPKAVLKARLSEMTWTVWTPYGVILQHNTPTAHELIQAAHAAEMNFWMSQVVGVSVILILVIALFLSLEGSEVRAKLRWFLRH